jgi:hypothetical protein
MVNFETRASRHSSARPHHISCAALTRPPRPSES